MPSIYEILNKSCPKCPEKLIGIELERVGLWEDGMVLHYANQEKNGKARLGAETILNLLQKEMKAERVEGMSGKVIGLNTDIGKVSLEPGSQLEFSTKPFSKLPTLFETVKEFESIVHKLTSSESLHWIGLGVNPVSSVSDTDLIPLYRYHLMNAYLPKKGKLATSMMRLSTSIQINIDYHSNEEAIEMLQASLLLAPLSYALFASSPFSEGKKSGLLSFRGEIWQHTDNDRSGLLPEAFSPDYSLEKYSAFLETYPLMFAESKCKEFIPMDGKSLKDIEEGKVPYAKPTFQNKIHAIRELFTEARIKPGYLEVRSIDGLPKKYREASIAFWVGLLLSSKERVKVIERLGVFAPSQRQKWWEDCLKEGFNARIGSLSTVTLAQEMVELSESALESRSLGEEKYLLPLKALIEKKKNLSDLILEKFPQFDQSQLPKLLHWIKEIEN